MSRLTAVVSGKRLNEGMHQLEPLPYPYDALEPLIDAETMRFHHEKHHQAYINKLNESLQSFPDLQNTSVEDLLADLDTIPESVRTQVRNFGGGHANHRFWWSILKTNEGAAPQNEIGAAINGELLGLEMFKKEFIHKTGSIFGSGWGWLVWDEGVLRIVTTANQDSPLSAGQIPLLGADVWEHAYYLKYQNKRNEYLENFFKVINWDQVNENYLTAKNN